MDSGVSMHLIKLDKDLDREIRAESTALNHLVERLGQAHADGRPSVQLKRCHSQRSVDRIKHTPYIRKTKKVRED